MRYEYSLWGCRVGIVFPVVKLRAYRERLAELEASDNPFATVVMAHLYSQATRLPDEIEQRLHTAMVQDLERWADRVLDARRLDEVFRDV